MSEPLTPPECDLRGLPFMPLDTVRLMDSDIYALSTGDEFKAALTLWAKAWQQVPAASLPDDDRVLAHLSGAGSKWKKVKAMALRGFVKCSDGRLYHPVVAEKAKDAWAHRLKQRDKANRRWLERGNATASPTASPTAVPEQSHGISSGNASKGTVKGQLDSEAKASAASGPRSDQDRLWQDGLPWLEKRSSKSPGALRSLVGKWARDHGATKVLEAIAKAQAESAVDPPAFVAACLGDKKSAEDKFVVRPLGIGG